MKKTINIAAHLLIILLAASNANATAICKELKGTSPGRIYLTPCETMGGGLVSSGQFPDVFANPVNPKLLGVCYASDPNQKLSLTYGGVPIKASSKSAWVQVDPIVSPLLSVITEFTLYTERSRYIAKFYSRETLTLGPQGGIELSTVVGGTDFFEGGKGSIAMESMPTDPTVPTLEIAPGFNIPYWVDFAVVNGTVCSNR